MKKILFFVFLFLCSCSTNIEKPTTEVKQDLEYGNFFNKKTYIHTRVVMEFTEDGFPVCYQESINSQYKFSEALWSDLNIEFVQVKYEILHLKFGDNFFDCLIEDSERNPDLLNIYFFKEMPSINGLSYISKQRPDGLNLIMIFVRGPVEYHDYMGYTLSHELGHQLFLLPHFWEEIEEDSNCNSGYGSPWFTDNVMDYSGDYNQTVEPCQVNLAKFNMFVYRPKYISKEEFQDDSK